MKESNGLKTAVKMGEITICDAKARLECDPMGKRSATWGWLTRRERAGKKPDEDHSE